MLMSCRTKEILTGGRREAYQAQESANAPVMTAMSEANRSISRGSALPARFARACYPPGPPSRAFEGHGHAHAARDAQRGQAQRVALLPHLVGAGEDDAGSGHADGVAEGDGPSVRIEAVVVELELAVAGQDLGGEGFVQLDHVEVLQGEAGLLQDLAGGGDHPDP